MKPKILQSQLREFEKFKNNKFLTTFEPGHFYSPIPNIHYIKSRESEIFDSNKVPRGVNLNDKVQIKIFTNISKSYISTDFPFKKSSKNRYFSNNPNYSLGDAIIYAGILKKYKPKNVIEIGSGYSSCVLLDINEKYLYSKTNITFIEPYPDLLTSLIKGKDLKIANIISTNLEKTDIYIFKKLKKNDILFIDSTHVSKVGSDVNQIVFNILPILKKGVIIHIHDVFYPFEYPKEWIYDGRAWNEDYLINAFLQFNDHFEIIYFNNYFAQKYKDTVKENIPNILTNPGGSIWLKKIK